MKKLLYPLTCALCFLLTGCNDVYEERETPAYRHSHHHSEPSHSEPDHDHHKPNSPHRSPSDHNRNR